MLGCGDLPLERAEPRVDARFLLAEAVARERRSGEHECQGKQKREASGHRKLVRRDGGRPCNPGRTLASNAGVFDYAPGPVPAAGRAPVPGPGLGGVPSSGGGYGSGTTAGCGGVASPGGG